MSYPTPWVADRYNDGRAFMWTRIVGPGAWQFATLDDHRRAWVPSARFAGGRTIRGLPVASARDARKAAAGIVEA